MTDMISVPSPLLQNEIPFWLVIPAAGTGSRVGGDLPKQYCKLSTRTANKTVLEHTLDIFQGIPCLKGIVIALHERDQYFSRLPVAKDALIKTVSGGKERADSVLNALNFLADKDNDNAWVLVHDAARPCVQAVDIVAMIQYLAASKTGGIMAVPVGDTIKCVNNQSEIVKTEDRRFLWQAQTPQMFRLDLLRKALHTACEKNLMVTDEASAMELSGYTPRVFQGKRSNIKITLPEDLMIAEALLRQSI